MQHASHCEASRPAAWLVFSPTVAITQLPEQYHCADGTCSVGSVTEGYNMEHPLDVSHKKLAAPEHTVWGFNHFSHMLLLWVIPACMRLASTGKAPKTPTWLVLKQKYTSLCHLIAGVLVGPKKHLCNIACSYTASSIPTRSQHKSFKLPRPNTLRQDTKGSFFGIYNTALRGFRGLIATQLLM